MSFNEGSVARDSAAFNSIGSELSQGPTLSQHVPEDSKMKDVVIRVDALSKCYQIYDKPHERLKQSLVPRFQRLIGTRTRQYFREFWALKGVSFEVQRGETLGIIGRNGSGKSTLLQLICGTLAPTTGSLEVNGRVAALLELGAGFNPEFTGRENIYMNASILGLTRAEIEERYEDILAFADIGDFINQPVKTYSSGMYVRLAFAINAHVDADILIIDEALAVGDVFFTQKCMRYLRAFKERGTLLFVTHDTGAVMNFCTRAILLELGQIQMQGLPKGVIEHYLASMYSESQEMDVSGIQNPSVSASHLLTDDFHDMRRDLVNGSTLRNDIEVFKFDLTAPSFGAGKAAIVDARLLDPNGNPLLWVVGGEMVELKVLCQVYESLQRPIIGFFLKDRLGQILFGENTYLTYRTNPQGANADTSITGSFQFRMPILPSGEYSFCLAIADGTQENHVQHHWIHDALIIQSHSTSTCTGLVGIPMRSISMIVN